MIHDRPVRFVVRPRARRISLRIDTARREAVAVLPRNRDKARAEALIAEKSAWLERHLRQLPPPMPFVPDGAVLLRGRLVTLRKLPGRGPAQEDGSALRVPCPAGAAFAGRVRRALIALAREALQARAHHHAAALGAAITGLGVRDTSSRWGSCAPNGRLNFSWRLVCAPPSVLDYVCAHEAAHLLEPNHGPRFWALVAQCVGDPKASRRWLRDHAAQLFAVGAKR